MAAGDVIASTVVSGVPFFPCGPCAFCHDRFGDVLNGIGSGIQQCTVCFTYSGDGFDYSVTFTGVNGTFSVTWDGSAWVNASIGTITVNAYPSTDGTCTGDPVVFTGDARVLVTCNQSGGKSFLFTNILGSVGDLPFSCVIFNSGGAEIDDANPNLLTFGQCGTDETPSVPIIGYDGIITLSA